MNMRMRQMALAAADPRRRARALRRAMALGKLAKVTRHLRAMAGFCRRLSKADSGFPMAEAVEMFNELCHSIKGMDGFAFPSHATPSLEQFRSTVAVLKRQIRKINGPSEYATPGDPLGVDAVEGKSDSMPMYMSHRGGGNRRRLDESIANIPTAEFVGIINDLLKLSDVTDALCVPTNTDAEEVRRQWSVIRGILRDLCTPNEELPTTTWELPADARAAFGDAYSLAARRAGARRMSKADPGKAAAVKARQEELLKRVFK